MNILTNFDFNKNQILNAVTHKLATAPGSPVEGQDYYDTAVHRRFTWNGTAWVGNDAVGATMTGADIVAAINGAVGSLIDDDNLSVAANAVFTKVGNIEANADVTDAGNVGPAIAGVTPKTPLVDADKIAITNSEATNALCSITWANFKASMKSYTDTLYNNYTLADGAVTLAKMANMATASFIGRNTAGTGVPEVLSVATVKTMLSLGTAAANATGDFATAAQGTLATNAIPKSTVTTADDFIVGTGASAVTRKTPTEVKSILALQNLTNDAQVKKLSSSTNGNIPTWNGTTGDALAAGYTVETTLIGGAGAIARADAVKTYIDGLLAASDAMIFKGTLGSSGTITAIPAAYNAGWAYKVITAATYAGIPCEVGDLIVAIVDRSSGGVNADWIAVQTNLDGAVTGPASATDSNFALYNGATGKLIKDGGVKASDFATSGHNHTLDALSNITITTNSNGEILKWNGSAWVNNTLAEANIAAADHVHNTFDRATSVLSGANVFSDIIVLDGIVTGISTRALTPADIGAATSGHNHDGTYPKKYTVAIGGSTSVVVTHNLNTRALVITLARSATPWDIVFADIELTTVNTATVKFAVAPSAGEYTITIVG